ncbi:unnamed protein product, partial [Closterium sp. Naga37s-1]
KVRSKVGRKLPPPSNETKTTVKAKTIVLPGQKLLDDRSQAAVSQRGHTLPELLAQSGHYSDKVRQESLVRLRELLAANPDELRRHAGTILAKLAPRIADVDKKTRDSLLLLMRSVLFPTMQPEVRFGACSLGCGAGRRGVNVTGLGGMGEWGIGMWGMGLERMAPFFTLLMGHVGCAMTHVAPDIRHAALPFLSALLAHYPSLFRSSSTAQVLLALPSPPLAPPPCHAPRGSLSSSPTRLAPSLLGHSRDPHHTPARSPQRESLIWNRCLTAICHYLFRRSLTFSVTPVFPFTFFPASTPSLPSTRPHLSPPLPPHAPACSTIISPPRVQVVAHFTDMLALASPSARSFPALATTLSALTSFLSTAFPHTSPSPSSSTAVAPSPSALTSSPSLNPPGSALPLPTSPFTHPLPTLSAPPPPATTSSAPSPPSACAPPGEYSWRLGVRLQRAPLLSALPAPSNSSFSSFPSSPSPLLSGFAPTNPSGCQSFNSIFPHMPEAAGAAVPAQHQQLQPHHQHHQQQHQNQQQQGAYGDALSRVLHKLGTAFPLHAPAGLAAARAKGTKGSNGTAGGAAAAGGGQQREVGEQLAMLNVLLAECLSLFLPASAAAAAAAGSGAAGGGGRAGKRRRDARREGREGMLGDEGGKSRGAGRGAVKGEARGRLLEGSRFVIRMSGGRGDGGGREGGSKANKGKKGGRESERGRGDTGDGEEAEEGGDEGGEEAEEEEEEEEAREEAWVGRLYDFMEGAMEGKLLPAPTASPILSRHVSESLIRRLLPLLPTQLHYAPSAARRASLLGGFSRLFSVSPARSATRAACLDVMFGLLQQQAMVLRIFFRIASISPPPSSSSPPSASSSSLSDHISSVQPLLVPFFAASIAARPAAPHAPAPSPAAAAPAAAAAEEAAGGHRLVVGPFLLLPAPLQALSLDLLLCFPRLSLPLLQSLAVCCIASHSLNSHSLESQTQQQQHEGQGIGQDASAAAAAVPRGMRWLAGRAVEVVGAAHRRGAVGLAEYLGFLVSLLLARTRAHSHLDITAAFQGRVRRHEEAERQHHHRHSHTDHAEPKGEVKGSPPSDLPRSKSMGSRWFLEDSSGLCREIWERETAVGAVCAALVHVPVGGSVGGGGGVGGQAGALMDGAAVLDLVSQPLAAALVNSIPNRHIPSTSPPLPPTPPLPPSRPLPPSPTPPPSPPPPHISLSSSPSIPPFHMLVPPTERPHHLPSMSVGHLQCCRGLLSTVSHPFFLPHPPLSWPPQSDPTTSPPCLYGIFRAVASCSHRSHLRPFPAPLGTMHGDHVCASVPVSAAASQPCSLLLPPASGAPFHPLPLACIPRACALHLLALTRAHEGISAARVPLAGARPAPARSAPLPARSEHLSTLSTSPTSPASPAPTRACLLRTCPWLVPALRLLALHPFLLAPFLHLLLPTEKQEQGAGAGDAGAGVHARAGVVCVAVLWGPLELPLLLLGATDRQQLTAGLAGLKVSAWGEG